MKNTLGGSPVARRQLGTELRRLRNEAGKTHADVAEALIASRTKMWRIENGETNPRPADVLALARLYGAGDEETDRLVGLARAAAASALLGDGISPWLGPYADFEASCSMLREYRSELVHGLLQTPEYARATISARPDLSPAVVEERVRFRMTRQRTFFDRPEPACLDFVTTAGALRVVVGSPSVMEAQIAHLRAVASRDGVSVRVLPSTNGVHSAMDCPFTILDFDDPDDPPLVYLESVTETRYVERPEHVQQFRDAFDRIRTQAVPLEEYLQ